MHANNIPLAERLRPNDFNNYIGQEHLIGKDSVLRKVIDSGHLPSIILWGPPGVGKTTLAKIISEKLDRPFYTLSAINSGVKDVREVIERAKSQGFFGTNNPILFIDEIHRFSKSQQDSLLGAVENGTITLIGATTENPSFEVISALLSRCQVYVLKSLEKEDLTALIELALKTDVDLKKKKVILKETESLLRISGGDARKLLNALELVINAVDKKTVTITNELVSKTIQANIVRYDKDGDQHYDIISAFIKSIRGSDPNASVYWLARMIEGGEDPKFIARRLLILASEDIGNANPTALVIANNCFQAVNVIGYPECRITLAQTVIYLSSSAKSNSSYEAINRAQQLVKKTGNLSVPLNIRNAPTSLMKDLGHGKDYKYAHAYEGNFTDEEFLPKEVIGTKLYEPSNNNRENEIRKNLKQWWKSKYDY